MLWAVILIATPAAAQSAAEIARQSRERGSLNLVDLEARLKLSTIQGEKRREQQLESAARRINGRLHSLTRFTAPASSAGVAVLTVESADGKESSISMWLPKLRRVRKVASSQRGEAFMQTDLTYGELTGAGAVRDDQLTREADTQLEGRAAFVLRAQPEGEYGEVRLFIDKESFVPLRVDYADKAGQPLKQYRALKLATFEGRTYAAQAVMENLQKGSRTELEVTSLQRSKRGDADFTERALERG